MRASKTLAALVLASVLAGCSGNETTPEPPVNPSVSEDDIRPALEAVRFDRLENLGILRWRGEPSVAAAPDGTLYVLASGNLWRSSDQGASWERLGESYCRAGLPVCPGFEEREVDLPGGWDGDLAVTVDGRLHFAGLGCDGQSCVPYMVSEDRGDTWSESVDLAENLSKDNQWNFDRQWLTHRASDDALFAGWRQLGEGYILRASYDGGQSWTPAQRIGEDGTSGPVVPDPAGRFLYWPHYDDGLSVGYSHDDGATWNDTAIPGLETAWPPQIFPVAAVDDTGNAYLVWATDTAVPLNDPSALAPISYFSASTDHGRTWTEPVVLSRPGATAVFPWIVAGEAGRVAIAWYENDLGTPLSAPGTWRVVLATTVTADQDAPEFALVTVTPDPVHKGAVCTQGGGCDEVTEDRSLQDFFEVGLAQDGLPFLAWAADSTIPQPVFNAMEIHAAKATGGTPLRTI